MAAKLKTFIIVQNDGAKTEVQAERGEQDKGSSRVTFFNGEESVASFINLQAWYEKGVTAAK